MGTILNMEPHCDLHISGNKPYWVLKSKTSKEKFIKNQNRKGYLDIFNSSWVTSMQTLEKEHLWHSDGYVLYTL